MSTVQLVLRIEDGSEPIAGQLERPGSPPQPFAGYLELIAALEATRDDNPRAEKVERSG